jgi:hypothetical protein
MFPGAGHCLLQVVQVPGVRGVSVATTSMSPQQVVLTIYSPGLA